MRELHEIDAARFRDEVLPAYEPVVLRGALRHWPVVEAGRKSSRDAALYLSQFDCGAPVDAFIGMPEIGGRYFYRDDMSGFNFEQRRGSFLEVLHQIVLLAERPNMPTIYAGAVPAPQILPGFAEANPMNLVDDPDAVPRIWVGNRTIVSTHFDESDNIACVAAGRRRFTLFPPNQVANLYVGPLDVTMAGQPTSMVNLADPDFDRYPRFREALSASLTAELEPGDAIYIPTLWWHHVEALDPFNILINYWWRAAPRDVGPAFEALVHGIWSIGNLPEYHREAWRQMFDLYVFRRNGDPAEHLAPEHRGILGLPSPSLRERMKQFLLRAISRH